MNPQVPPTDPAALFGSLRPIIEALMSSMFQQQGGGMGVQDVPGAQNAMRGSIPNLMELLRKKRQEQPQMQSPAAVPHFRQGEGQGQKYKPEEAANTNQGNNA